MSFLPSVLSVVNDSFNKSLIVCAPTPERLLRMVSFSGAAGWGVPNAGVGVGGVGGIPNDFIRVFCFSLSEMCLGVPVCVCVCVCVVSMLLLLARVLAYYSSSSSSSCSSSSSSSSSCSSSSRNNDNL